MPAQFQLNKVVTLQFAEQSEAIRTGDQIITIPNEPRYRRRVKVWAAVIAVDEASIGDVLAPVFGTVDSYEIAEIQRTYVILSREDLKFGVIPVERLDRGDYPRTAPFYGPTRIEDASQVWTLRSTRTFTDRFGRADSRYLLCETFQRLLKAAPPNPR